MSVLCKTVAKNIGLGAAGSTVVVTGAGFTPKAVIAIATGRTTNTDSQAAETSRRSIGFAGAVTGGISNRCICGYSAHNAAPASMFETSRNRSDALVMEQKDSFGAYGAAHVSSFNNDGCVLTIDQPFDLDLRVMFMFLGGTDITNVAIGTYINPIAGTVPFNFDVTGLGFTPTIGRAAGFILQTSTNEDNDVIPDTDLMFGAFVRASEQGVLLAGCNSQPASLSQAVSACQNSECAVGMNPNVNQIERRMAFVNWITDGFRLSCLERPSSNATVAYWMVINGGKWALETFTTKTTAADIVIDQAGVGTPVGGIVCSHMKAKTAVDALSDDAAWSVGIFDSPTSRYAVAQFEKDNVNPSATAQAIQHDEVYINVNQTGAIQGLMDVKTLDADGITFTMDDADPVAAFGWTLLVGSVTGGAPPPPTQGPLGPLQIKFNLPADIPVGAPVYVAVMSNGQTSSDGVPTVDDDDTFGQLYTLLASSTDHKASLYCKIGSDQTGGKQVTVTGGRNTMTAVAFVINNAEDDPINHNIAAIDVGSVLNIPAFTPDVTDSMVLVIIYGMTAVIPGTPAGQNSQFPFTKLVDAFASQGGGASIAVFASSQDGGPFTTGLIEWASGPPTPKVIRLSIAPILGQGQGWTTQSVVDETGEQNTSERPLFGTYGGHTFTLSDVQLDNTGFWLSKLKGDETQMVSLDRVKVVCSATQDSVVGVSFTYDGGLTYSTEVLIPVFASQRGNFYGSGWSEEQAVNLFQVRIRVREGDAIIHKVNIYGQPRGSAF